MGKGTVTFGVEIKDELTRGLGVALKKGVGLS
jgi:hypothetical protein